MRHSDIRVTADYYADKKQRISTGLGSLLPAQNVIVFQPETAVEASNAKQKQA